MRRLRTSVIVTCVAAATTAALTAAPTPAATPPLVRIDARAEAPAAGRVIAISGVATCVRGNKLRIRMVVIQRTAGALAEGELPAPVACTGGPQQWSVEGQIKGIAEFKRARAQACVLVTTRRRRTFTAMRQLCKEVSVVVLRQRA